MFKKVKKVENVTILNADFYKGQKIINYRFEYNGGAFIGYMVSEKVTDKDWKYITGCVKYGESILTPDTIISEIDSKRDILMDKPYRDEATGDIMLDTCTKYNFGQRCTINDAGLYLSTNHYNGLSLHEMIDIYKCVMVEFRKDTLYIDPLITEFLENGNEKEVRNFIHKNFSDKYISNKSAIDGYSMIDAIKLADPDDYFQYLTTKYIQNSNFKEEFGKELAMSDPNPKDLIKILENGIEIPAGVMVLRERWQKNYLKDKLEYYREEIDQKIWSKIKKDLADIGYEPFEGSRISNRKEYAYLYGILAQSKKGDNYVYGAWTYNEYVGLQMGHLDIKDPEAAKTDYYMRLDPSIRPAFSVLKFSKEIPTQNVKDCNEYAINDNDTVEEIAYFESLTESKNYIKTNCKPNLQYIGTHFPYFSYTGYAIYKSEFDTDGNEVLLNKELCDATGLPIAFDPERKMSGRRNTENIEVQFQNHSETEKYVIFIMNGKHKKSISEIADEIDALLPSYEGYALKLKESEFDFLNHVLYKPDNIQ